MDEEDAFEALVTLRNFAGPEPLREFVRGSPEKNLNDQDARKMERIIDVLGEDRVRHHLDMEDASDESEGLEQFGSGGGADTRRTGTVRAKGSPGEVRLVGRRSDGGNLPPSVENAALDAVEDALGDLARFPPDGTDVATIVYDEDGIDQLTISYDPVADPPRQVNGFDYQGETTYEFSDDYGTRYSYCGPLLSDIRTDFTPSPEESREPIPEEELADARLVRGPSTGTIKPGPDSPIVMTPAGQVVGLDQSALEDTQEGLCLWVDIVQELPSGDWTVLLDVRPENSFRDPEVGVDISVAGGVPPTRTGAFAAALVLMDGGSPSGLFTDLVDEIEERPGVAAADPDLEDDLADALGDLEAQVERQSRFDVEETQQQAASREQRQRERERQQEADREPGQLDLGTAGQTDRFSTVPDDMNDDDDDDDEGESLAEYGSE